ncbi:hypothetical protein CUMW_232400, partial [Citrus unshiu]
LYTLPFRDSISLLSCIDTICHDPTQIVISVFYQVDPPGMRKPNWEFWGFIFEA